jgi:phage terminase large subunit-like protein
VSQVSTIRHAAESSLLTFIRLVAPHRVLGACHEELISWWEREDAKSHQLVLLPRDHMKSALMAYRVAHRVTKNPAIRILYISSTSKLAVKQLKMIKDILTSKIYRRYWPDMVKENESDREKWTETEIAVDHPARAKEGVRDPTVFTGGLTTSVTGMHCDIAVLDDTVVQENAYTEEGREKVRTQYSLLASIEGADALEWVVGTRYHPDDLYAAMQQMEEEILDKAGNTVSKSNVYEIFERKVEDRGDGAGEYLWPRQQRADGKWFGYNQAILAKKKAQYLDKTQFYAQYYNDPNKYDESNISPSKFQYFDRSQVVNDRGRWFVRGNPVNLYAAMDLAYSEDRRSDYSAIVVVGIDPDGNIYVLDIDRFKTEKISEMFEHLRDFYIKWGFRKAMIESGAAQKAVVRELKDSYLRPANLALSIDEKASTSHMGSKEERIGIALEPRYTNMQIWHYKGGNCQVLEEEILQRHPRHDDVKDALAMAVTIAIPPRDARKRRDYERVDNVVYHRFGGFGS